MYSVLKQNLLSMSCKQGSRRLLLRWNVTLLCAPRSHAPSKICSNGFWDPSGEGRNKLQQLKWQSTFSFLENLEVSPPPFFPSNSLGHLQNPGISGTRRANDLYACIMDAPDKSERKTHSLSLVCWFFEKGGCLQRARMLGGSVNHTI